MYLIQLLLMFELGAFESLCPESMNGDPLVPLLLGVSIMSTSLAFYLAPVAALTIGGGTLSYCLMPETQGPGLCRTRVSAPPTEAPHGSMGGCWVERCYPWTRTVQGFASRVGHVDDGRRCLGEEG